MKKLIAVLMIAAAVVVALAFGLGYCAANPAAFWGKIGFGTLELSEQGDSLCRLHQSINQLKISLAEATAVYSDQEKKRATSQQMIDQGEALLKQAESNEPFKIGAGTYTKAEIEQDLASRKEQLAGLTQGIESKKQSVASLTALVAENVKVVVAAKTNLKQKGQPEEAIRAELKALISDDQIANEIGWISRKTLNDSLVKAQTIFQKKLDAISAAPMLENAISDLIDWQETAIPDSDWNVWLAEQREKVKTESMQLMIKNGVDACRQQDYNSAVAFFNQAIQADPGNVSALSKKGIALALLENFDAAGKLLDQALAVDPSCNEARLAKANVILLNVELTLERSVKISINASKRDELIDDMRQADELFSLVLSDGTSEELVNLASKGKNFIKMVMGGVVDNATSYSCKYVITVGTEEIVVPTTPSSAPAPTASAQQSTAPVVPAPIVPESKLPASVSTRAKNSPDVRECVVEATTEFVDSDIIPRPGDRIQIGDGTTGHFQPFKKADDVRKITLWVGNDLKVSAPMVLEPVMLGENQWVGQVDINSVQYAITNSPERVKISEGTMKVALIKVEK